MLIIHHNENHNFYVHSNLLRIPHQTSSLSRFSHTMNLMTKLKSSKDLKYLMEYQI